MSWSQAYTMRILLVAVFVCMALAAPRVRQVKNLSNKNRISGEFLIVLRPNHVRTSNVQYSSAVADKIAEISSKIVIIKRFTNLLTPIFLVRITDESVINNLFQLHEVESIEANVFQQMTQQCSTQNSGSRLWGLSRISSVPLPNFNNAQFSYKSGDGSGVRVYVFDTGVRLTHQDFRGRVEFGLNTVGGSNDDNHGHGTHCAGTVGGTEYGVAKGTTLVAMKVLGDFGSGTFEGIIDGINWAVGDLQSRGVRGVLSMSLGGGASAALDSAVNSADAAGVPVVTAAGNSNCNACNMSPGRASGAINVGNTDITDGLYETSCWGSCVDILAPGTNILSASHLSDSGSIAYSGTSMACPHVAGVIAIYLSANPNASTAQVKSFLTSSATKGAINLRGMNATPNLLLYSTC